MNQLLSAATTQAEHFVGNTFGERASYALSHTGVGMLIIFAVLAVIWAVLAVFKVIFAGKTDKKEKVAETPEKKSEVVPSTPAPVATVPIAASSTDEEIVAAITAAITLMREAEGTSGTFRVVSFRRTGGARPWNQA